MYISTPHLPKGKNVLRVERKRKVSKIDEEPVSPEEKRESGRHRIHTIPFWVG